MKKFCFVLAVCALVFNSFKISADVAPDNYILVSASASTELKPDRATISFLLKGEDPEITNAKNKNNDLLRKVKDAVKKFGIKDEDIQMGNITIELKKSPADSSYFAKTSTAAPQSEANMKVTGYIVSNSLSITVSGIDNVDVVVGTCIKVGAENFTGLSFSVGDKAKYHEELREKALARAKEKAVKMAAALNCKVGSVLYIEEENSRSEDKNLDKSKIVITESVSVRFELE